MYARPRFPTPVEMLATVAVAIAEEVVDVVTVERMTSLEMAEIEDTEVVERSVVTAATEAVKGPVVTEELEPPLIRRPPMTALFSFVSPTLDLM